MASMTPRSDHQTATVRRRSNRRTLRRRDGLISHARDATSQNGEDGVIARLFELLPPPSDGKRRQCVDVGAWDGVHLSNTHSLLVGNEGSSAGGDGEAGGGSGWSGVLIEADVKRFEELRSLHQPLGNVCVRAEVSCMPGSDRSLASILRREAPELPKDFDFLTIDVDGTDYWLLADILGLSQEENGFDGGADSGFGVVESMRDRVHYLPMVICIEFNPTMPDDLIFIQPRNDGMRYGSSLSALVELASSAGYTLVETTLFNAFFVRDELYERYLSEEVPDTSIEALHEVTMGTELYQLYDGTIKLWGCKRMLWHRMPMDEKKMQILSPAERSFPFAPESESDHDARLKGEQIIENAVDMTPYFEGSDSGSDDSRQECSSRLCDALRNDGFALVRGTGIPGNIVKDALRAAISFLHEADEDVRRSCLTRDRARRGYSPMCTENFASLVGEMGPNDLVKKYRLGPRSADRDSDSLSSLHQPNAWPSDEIWGTHPASFFRSCIERYFDSLCTAAECILEAICDGILSKDVSASGSISVFRSSVNDSGDTESKNHTSILTLLGYQPGSRHKKGGKGYMRPLVSAHTDVGVITVLHFDDGRCASLQRAADASNRDPECNEWVDIELPAAVNGEDYDPVFVVNVGDCLSELSGGSLRSTLHRVSPCPCPKGLSAKDAARTCLALFVGLEPDASLLLPSGDVITYEKWRQQRIARAIAVLKN